MAHITDTAPQARGESTLSRIGNAIITGMEKIAQSNARVQQFERLSAMSDAQLAERGLRREDIVRHVFRDILYV